MALAIALLTASCSTVAEVPPLELAAAGFAAPGAPLPSEAPQDAALTGDGATSLAEAENTEGFAALPATTAAFPGTNPLRPAEAAAPMAATTALAPAPSAPDQPVPEEEIRLAALESAPVAADAAPGADVVPIREAVLTADHSVESIYENPKPTKKPKGGLFASLFAAPRPAEPVKTARPAVKAAPVVLASAAPETGESLRSALTGSELPGVRQSSLFEITRKSGTGDDSDVDLNEEVDQPVQIASAAGLARLAPNGLLVQREDVETACLKPELVRMLHGIERHYGKRLVVTSGYRSPTHNRKVRGARKSMHMYCAAADIQIEGVGKWELARYLRTMPGRGGVGTYCHTDSVHVDIGPERDWNWRCRRSKKG